jgi:hypothetical protein
MEVFMKNKLFLTGMAALLLSFGLVLAGCPTDPVEETTDAATPVISVQPQDQTYGDGDTANPLTVGASVSDGGTLSYQWYSNTANSATGGTAISTATTASYTPPITTNGTVYYYVVVTNTNNSATGAKTAAVTSAVAEVKKVEGSLIHATAPSITAQPVGASYTAGATATALSVTANVTDSGTLSYQWYSNTADSAAGGSPISGATQSAYTPPITTAGTVYYYVIVTNTNNDASVTGTKVVTAASDVAAITVTGGNTGGGLAVAIANSDGTPVTAPKVGDVLKVNLIGFELSDVKIIWQRNDSAEDSSADEPEEWGSNVSSDVSATDTYTLTAQDEGEYIRAWAYNDNYTKQAVSAVIGPIAAAGSGGTPGGDDSLTWTAVADATFGTDGDIYGIAYGGGKFVAVGDNGTAAYSADGVTWTAVADTKFGSGYNDINGIAYGGGKFVAVGGGGRAAYSADGVTWAAVADAKFGAWNDIRGIAYGGGKFVAVGYEGKAAYSNPQE